MSYFKNTLEKLWQKDTRLILIALLLLAFSSGYFFSDGSSSVENNHDHATEASISVWTCSMHPQIQQPQFGQCPICGMDLIPVEDDAGAELGERELKLSPAAIKLAAIQTAPVERKFVASEIRMNGKVAYDETRLKDIAAYVPGRIDRLYVDFTGTTVRRGDHLADLYSPKLISAQEELLQAKKALSGLSANAASNIRSSAENTLAAVREKLRLLGLTEQQIRNIESRNAHSDRLTIYSPISGVVIKRNVSEGMYVQTGTRIYTLADLEKLWILLDAYESDLEWLRYGQSVDFTTEAYPGEVFSGIISFIDPVLNPQTRTVKVRVNITNPSGKLKPAMFVRAVVKSRLTASGKVMDPQLSGKWISPMHPEIVKNNPGDCDVCGMKLVRAETLGYTTTSEKTMNTPLVIPATAPLRTGQRAIVYVSSQDREGVFENREITLGPRTGDYYVVYDGLQEGELVVTNGNFKLDSDLQIRAKPSMMNPGSGSGSGSEFNKLADIPETFNQSLLEMLESYFAIQQNLSGDDLSATALAGQRFQKALDKIDAQSLSGDAESHWHSFQASFQKSSGEIVTAKSIEAARSSFQPLSDSLYQLLKMFGVDAATTAYRFYCPMAFDNTGAYWLQNNDLLANPYFGAAMLRCGEQTEVIGNHDGHNHE